MVFCWFFIFVKIVFCNKFKIVGNNIVLFKMEYCGVLLSYSKFCLGKCNVMVFLIVCCNVWVLIIFCVLLVFKVFDSVLKCLSCCLYCVNGLVIFCIMGLLVCCFCNFLNKSCKFVRGVVNWCVICVVVLLSVNSCLCLSCCLWVFVIVVFLVFNVLFNVLIINVIIMVLIIKLIYMLIKWWVICIWCMVCLGIFINKKL